MRSRIVFRLAFFVTLIAIGASAQKARSFALEPLSPKFQDLISSDAKLETVATGFGFTEGPMWDPAGFLYVSDETINKIFRVYPDGKKEEVIALGDPDGNTFDRRPRVDRLRQRSARDHRGHSRRKIQSARRSIRRKAPE